MPKPPGDSAPKRKALFLSPEAPFPAIGGGALRSASLLEYLAQRYSVDAILFRQPGDPDPAAAIPPGHVDRTLVLDLPAHRKDPLSRATRNLGRAIRGRPPLLDRFSGFSTPIGTFASQARYDVAIIEHFWCAPYRDALRPHCRRIVLDLHNIESVWHLRLADTEPWPQALLHRRFSAIYRRLESRRLQLFDAVLATSEQDAALVRTLGPGSHVSVYPNAIPEVPPPPRAETESVVFAGNLEYQPNISAIRFFQTEIWPSLRERFPNLTWRILGKNPDAVAAMLRSDSRIQLVGPVPDAISALAESRVAVVPLLAGSGTRIKILEAWAAATPVVSTTLGAEGLASTPGEHLLIANNPGDFAEAVATLLTSRDQCDRIGQAGRQLYEALYMWPVAWRTLDGVVDKGG
jgi:glycosyltransferase involved in cell wall biosynthesis